MQAFDIALQEDGIDATVCGWLEAWNETNGVARGERNSRCFDEEGTFRDRLGHGEWPCATGSCDLGVAGRVFGV